MSPVKVTDAFVTFVKVTKGSVTFVTSSVKVTVHFCKIQ